MKWWRFNGVLTKAEATVQWLEPAFVQTDERGLVVALTGTEPSGMAHFERIDGYLAPGMQNGHSHVFQYAMAGVAERAGADLDDFWAWRNAMYRLALGLSPDQLEAIAAFVYAEMARFGYTAVAEFHYLHNTPAGPRYDRAAAMAARLVAAAAKAGICLTLIPVYYERAGFGVPAAPAQRRFLSQDPESYLRLLDDCRMAARGYQRAQVGAGVHSLRAATLEDVRKVYGALPKDMPFHIHIAEQQREVEDCLAHYGKRPVAALFDAISVDERVSLVHATHVDEIELTAIAKSGATVVLCPSTEANLGDGFFPFVSFMRQHGTFAIGSDSNICLNPFEELRWLDYGQRLLERRRTFAQDDKESGSRLFKAAWEGGRAAVGGLHNGFFAVGSPLDGIVIDAEHPIFQGKIADQRLSALVFASDPSALLGTLVHGEWLVKGQVHRHYPDLYSNYKKTMLQLS